MLRLSLYWQCFHDHMVNDDYMYVSLQTTLSSNSLACKPKVPYCNAIDVKK